MFTNGGVFIIVIKIVVICRDKKANMRITRTSCSKVDDYY